MNTIKEGIIKAGRYQLGDRQILITQNVENYDQFVNEAGEQYATIQPSNDKFAAMKADYSALQKEPVDNDSLEMGESSDEIVPYESYYSKEAIVKREELEAKLQEEKNNDENKNLEDNNKFEEAVNIKDIIGEVIDTNWSGSNDEQMKAVQLLKGLATSDDSLSNKFMKALDKATSSMKKEDFKESKIIECGCENPVELKLNEMCGVCGNEHYEDEDQYDDMDYEDDMSYEEPMEREILNRPINPEGSMMMSYESRKKT